MSPSSKGVIMRKSENLILSRRVFIASASSLLVGSRLSAMFPFSANLSQVSQELREELTPEELKMIEKSTMAEDLMNYFGKGYSCAESLLMVSLRLLGKSEDMVWAAAGYGGGLYHKDLCGFLTAGIMGIGFSAGMLKKERKVAKEYSSRLVKQYWKWWISQAPLHCSEIRKKGTSSKVCRRLGQLSAAKVEELIKAAIA